MRKLIILSGAAALILASCKKEEIQAPPTPKCMLKCQDPTIKVQLPFKADTLKGLVLIKFANDGSYSDTLEMGSPQTIVLNIGADYRMYLPVIKKWYQIGYINSTASERLGYCDDVCVNPVPGIKVSYDWQPVSYTMKLTDKLEYTLIL
jgi:hypothetical protein